jgi:hypothetical protein
LEVTPFGRLLLEVQAESTIASPLFRSGSEVAQMVARWGSTETNPYYGKDAIAAAAINGAIRGDRSIPDKMRPVIEHVVKERGSSLGLTVDLMTPKLADAFTANKQSLRLDGRGEDMLWDVVAQKIGFSEAVFTSELIRPGPGFISPIRKLILRLVALDAKSVIETSWNPRVTILASSFVDGQECWERLYWQFMIQQEKRPLWKRFRTINPAQKFADLNLHGILRILVVNPAMTSVPAMAIRSKSDDEITTYLLNAEFTSAGMLMPLPKFFGEYWARLLSEVQEAGLTLAEQVRWVIRDGKVSVEMGDDYLDISPLIERMHNLADFTLEDEEDIMGDHKSGPREQTE